MLSRLSKKMTSYFISKKRINESEREVYDYCFEILLSTIINLLMLIIAAIISKTYLETLCFAITFMFMRKTAGGFHAKTHIGCLITLLIFYGGLVVIVKTLHTQVLVLLSIIFLATSSILILLLSPVDSINKQLSKNEKKAQRIKSWVYLFIFILCSAIQIFFQSTQVFSFAISYTLEVIAVSLLIGKIKNIVDEKNKLKSPKLE